MYPKLNLLTKHKEFCKFLLVMAMDTTFGTTIWLLILPCVNYLWLWVLPSENSLSSTVLLEPCQPRNFRKREQLQFDRNPISEVKQNEPHSVYHDDIKWNALPITRKQNKSGRSTLLLIHCDRLNVVPSV